MLNLHENPGGAFAPPGPFQLSSKRINATARITAAKSHFTSTTTLTRGFISKPSGRERPQTPKDCGMRPTFRFNRRS